MNKTSWKSIHRLLGCIAAAFVLIYLLVFIGGWRLLESGDMVMIEIAVAVLVGIILWLFFEQARQYDERLRQLEERISELERRANVVD